jgi:hypothetical protein
MTHDQIREMVRRANPVADPISLQSVMAADLIIDDEWRMEMQTEDRTTATQVGRKKWSGPMVGIAAAAVILLGGLVYFLTRDDTPEVVQPAPNATEITLDMEFQPIEPGAYYTDTDGAGTSTVRGTFVIEPDGWSGHLQGAMKEAGPETYVAHLVQQVAYVASPGCHQTEWVPAAGTADELADQFATLPGFIIRQAVAPVVAFGHEGYHMVAEVPDEGFAPTPTSAFSGCQGDGEFDGWYATRFAADEPLTRDRYYQAPGQTLEFWFLDVGGTPVVVEATTFPTSPAKDVAELEAILDTLVITP